MVRFLHLVSLASLIACAWSFAPIHTPALIGRNRISSSPSSHLASTTADYDEKIASCKDVLVRTVETKSEDPEIVLQALEDLEKLMRQKRKEEPETAAQEVLDNLTGSWRLVFTTGTKSTQDRFKAKINYFPIKVPYPYTYVLSYHFLYFCGFT